MGEPGFWDRPRGRAEDDRRAEERARVVTGFDGPAKGAADLRDLFELARAENDAATLDAVAHELDLLEPKIHDLELESLLAGDNDHLGAVVTITPGAGGTESQDWAQMLFRMYTRMCERKGWNYTVLDLQAGDEAGIKAASLEVNTEYAYGFLQLGVGRPPPRAHLAVRCRQAPAHVVHLGVRLPADRRHDHRRPQGRRPARRHLPRLGRGRASMSTRPSRRSASRTCRPASSCSRRPSAASTRTASSR
jgi:hypothetical protein